jgi:hypothetical protein
MALNLITTPDGLAAIGSDATTGERGFLFKLTNKTGAASVKGSIIGPATGTDAAFILDDTGFDPIGAVAEAGIADGAACWCWGVGSICQVLMKDSTAAVIGQVALADDVDGRTYSITVPSASPAAAEHFREVGHFLESQDAGTDVLALAILHFN